MMKVTVVPNDIIIVGLVIIETNALHVVIIDTLFPVVIKSCGVRTGIAVGFFVILTEYIFSAVCFRQRLKRVGGYGFARIVAFV